MGMAKLSGRTHSAMKTPVGARSSAVGARRPLQQQPVASNQNNLSHDSTKEKKKTNNMEGKIEKKDVLKGNFSKQMCNAKGEFASEEPRIAVNIQLLSKAMETLGLNEACAHAKSDLQNKLVKDEPGGGEKEDAGAKAKKLEEKKVKSEKDQEVAEDEKPHDSQKQESDLCSRGPTKSAYHIQRTTPYMNNSVCSWNHQSGGGLVSDCEAPLQPLELQPEVLQTVSRLLEYPAVSNAVDTLVGSLNTGNIEQLSCSISKSDLPLNIPAYNGISSTSKVYTKNLVGCDEGLPGSPCSLSPASVLDLEYLVELDHQQQQPPAELDPVQNRSDTSLSLEGPQSVDSGTSPSPPPPLRSHPHHDFNAIRSGFPHVSAELFSESPISPLSPRKASPNNSSFVPPKNVCPAPVNRHNVPVQCHTASSPPSMYSGSKPHSQTPKIPPKLLPRLPEKKPAHKKLHAKLDKEAKNYWWTRVNYCTNEDLTNSDADGDTQLMIILSNKREHYLERVYALVERLRKIPGALSAENKKGHSALYIASVHVPSEPLVAAYLAEALVEQGVNVAQLQYEGLPLIECIKKRGPSHQQVLNELLLLKDCSGQFVFPQNNYSINVSV